MRSSGEHAPVAVEEADKEKKRRRRQNRRPKQNVAGFPGGASSSMDAACCRPKNWSESGGGGGRGPEAGLLKASKVAFSSLPTMHVSGEGGADGVALPSVAAEEISRSCPLPTTSSPLEDPQGRAKKKVFSPHWSDEEVERAIQRGNAFKATFRVNAHNRLEAYCTIDGVPVDVLISGVPAQNRAESSIPGIAYSLRANYNGSPLAGDEKRLSAGVERECFHALIEEFHGYWDPLETCFMIEGDVVAVRLDPVAFWTRLKGSNVPSIPVPADDPCMLSKMTEVVGNNCAGTEQVDRVDAICQCHTCSNGVLPLDRDHQYHENGCISEADHSDQENRPGTSNNKYDGCYSTASGSSNASLAIDKREAERALERIQAMINSYPSKRPTGRVLSIIRMSPRRGTVIGFLSFKQWLPEGEEYRKQITRQISKKCRDPLSLSDEDHIQLIPTDSKFPKMVVTFKSLPDCVKERLKNDGITVERELVAAQIDEWNEESLYPQAHVIHILGKGGEIEPQISAILFENAISVGSFSLESLACLSDVRWKVPVEEYDIRKDLRNICTFTIDPSSARDLDDALSFETLSDERFRVGVHIADATYFVHPNTALDTEAQIRSTSVYILHHRLPMLPSRLSEELCSLNPGVDRLAFSIIWDIDRSGNIIDRWIGRSVIHSCCKLSYELVQDILGGSLDIDQHILSRSSSPQLHGQSEWKDVVKSLQGLHEISKKLRESRFKDGALWLESAKLVFLLDESGTPYDSFLNERMESCSLVEEFMLLANRSAAEVISRALPDCALLRRHPEPNVRKLKEFEAFCGKHGFELDTSSSGQLHLSLSKIREKLRDDPVLSDIFISYASKPMQLATYFCTGDLRGRENDWAHYSLSVPFYTHFTSPLRRYPDIIVHRTLSAVLDAEESYLKQRQSLLKANNGEASGCEIVSRCFTGLDFDRDAADSEEGREILSAAALKFNIPGAQVLAEVAAYCNERKLASKHAEEAGEKLFLWALLKKKEVLVSEARVLGLGPRFMSVYIHKFAIERRIYYDEVEGLTVEWLENTCTLVLDVLRSKSFQRRGSLRKSHQIEDVALLVNPSEMIMPEAGKEVAETEPTIADFSSSGHVEKIGTCPAVFPLVLQLLSTVPVALCAVGGDSCPLDVGVRLYMCSYYG